MVVIGLALGLPGIFTLGTLLVVIILTLLAGERKEFGKLLSGLSPFSYIIPILFVLNSVFYAGGSKLWNPSYLPFSITMGGITRASIISLRLIGVAAVSLWFARTTEAEELEVALSRLGFPWKLSFMVSLTLRLVPEFKGKFRSIKESQTSRGLETGGSPLSRIRANINLMIPFLASIVRYGYELGEALRARGFELQNKRTFLLELKTTRGDYFFCLYGGLLLAVFIFYHFFSVI